MSLRKIKKMLCLALSVVMIGAVVAGCGSTASDTTDTTEDTTTEETSAVAEADTSADEELSEEDTAAIDEFAASLEGMGDGLTVGVCMGDLSSTYIVSASSYFKKIMEAAGAEVTIVNCDGDTSLQSDQIADFVNMGVDIICVHANDPSGVAPAVEAAVEAGIPVVGFNKTVEGDNLNFEVNSSDNVETGAAAAQYLADKAAELGVENPKIAVMQGTMTASDAYLRQEGIERVAEEEGLVLINEPCEWSNDKSESALNDVLTANPDLFGIIVHSDCMASGVVSALTQNGLAVDASDENHIYFVSIDCDETGIDCLNSGVADASIEQNPLALATVIAKGCLTIVQNGETLDGEVFYMDTTVVTADMTGESDRWATYDPDTATSLWDGSEAIWNAYLN